MAIINGLLAISNVHCETLFYYDYLHSDIMSEPIYSRDNFHAASQYGALIDFSLKAGSANPGMKTALELGEMILARNGAAWIKQVKDASGKPVELVYQPNQDEQRLGAHPLKITMHGVMNGGTLRDIMIDRTPPLATSKIKPASAKPKGPEHYRGLKPAKLPFPATPGFARIASAHPEIAQLVPSVASTLTVFKDGNQYSKESWAGSLVLLDENGTVAFSQHQINYTGGKMQMWAHFLTMPENGSPGLPSLVRVEILHADAKHDLAFGQIPKWAIEKFHLKPVTWSNSSAHGKGLFAGFPGGQTAEIAVPIHAAEGAGNGYKERIFETNEGFREVLCNSKLATNSVSGGMSGGGVFDPKTLAFVGITKAGTESSADFTGVETIWAAYQQLFPERAGAASFTPAGAPLAPTRAECRFNPALATTGLHLH